MKHARTSISQLLSLYIGGGLMVMILLWGVLISQGVTGLVQDGLEDTARALARQLAIVSLDAMLLQDYGMLERFVTDLAGQSHMHAIRIERADGELLAEAVSGEFTQARLRILDEPIVLLDRELGRVRVSYVTEAAESLAWRLVIMGSAAALVLGVVVFLLLQRVLARRLIRPVRLLAEGVSPLRASPQLPHDAPQELATLAHSFEQMREELRAHLDARDRALHFAREATERLVRDRQLVATGQLAAGLAHGLNTPLGNIVGYSQMAREVLATPGGIERAREQLGIIERQAESCGRIVRDLMTASREPAAEMSLIELAPQLDATARLVRPLLKEYGVCTLEWRANDHLRAWGDPTVLEHVLFNLLTNAAQAGAQHVEMVAGDDALGVFIDVKDDGSGLSENVRTRAFEPFVSSKRAGEGTGLGLYMCRILLNSLGGEIELLASQPGETIFRLHLRRP